MPPIAPGGNRSWSGLAGIKPRVGGFRTAGSLRLTHWQQGRFDYWFDAKGRRLYEQRDWGQADGFQYDPSDQVREYKRDGSLNGEGTVSLPFWSTNVLTYNNNGNRTEVTGPGGGSYSPNHLNQYTSAANVSGLDYDGKGNLRTAAGWTYIYDAQNRLLRMETPGCVVEHAYDALNRLVTRNVNGVVTQYVWDGWNLIQQHRPDWSIQRCYLHGANQNEMVTAFDGNVYSNHWYWQDGRGNTSHITGDNAFLLERYTYDLNGLPRFYDENGWERSASAYDTRFLFAGSQFLPDINLYDMRNRFYHITLNRFLQTDPIGFKGDPLNLYRYCHNDAVDFSDPMGLIAVDDRWSRLMYWQGNAQETYNQIAEAYRNWQPASREAGSSLGFIGLARASAARALAGEDASDSAKVDPIPLDSIRMSPEEIIRQPYPNVTRSFKSFTRKIPYPAKAYRNPFTGKIRVTVPVGVQSILPNTTLSMMAQRPRNELERYSQSTRQTPP